MSLKIVMEFWNSRLCLSFTGLNLKQNDRHYLEESHS